MRHWIIGLAAAALLASPASAATDIPVTPGKSWKHEATGAVFPDQLAGLKRRQVVYFSAPQVDVAGDYWSADGNDAVTVYLYRNVTGSVPLWFDRSRHFILNLPEKFGDAKGMGARAFTPRGQTLATGLIESFEISKGARSSGLMILPFNGFYAKIRASSKTRDVASLEALMLEAANAFDWSSKAPSVAAAPIADCESPLAFRDKAKLIEASSQDRMMAGILGGLFAQVSNAKQKKDARPGPPITFCREAAHQNLNYGMYRPDGDKERYTLAILDGGRAVTVGRNTLAELVSDKSKSPSPRYSVSFVQLDKVETYGDFTSLPAPGLVAEHIEKSRPVSIAGTWGKANRQVTIPTD